jgi:hypothetical protein
MMQRRIVADLNGVLERQRMEEQPMSEVDELVLI